MYHALNWSFYLWFLFIFIIAVALFMPLQMRISFNNLRKDNSVSLKVEIFLPGSLKVACFNKKIMLYEDIGKKLLTKDSLIFFEKGSYKKILSLLCWIFKHFNLISLEIKAKIGTGDAAWTAMIVAFLRKLPEIIYPFFHRRMFFEKRPCILIYPSFSGRELIFFCSIKFYIKGIVILYCAVFFLWQTIFRAKNQHLRRMIRNDRASHTGSDAHCHGKPEGNGRCY